MKISILGDSISTYEGWNPPRFTVFYKDAIKRIHGLEQVEDTWWYRVIKELNWDDLKTGFTIDNTEMDKLAFFLRHLDFDPDLEKTLFVIDDTCGPCCLALEAAVTLYCGQDDHHLWASTFLPFPDSELFRTLCVALGLSITDADIQEREEAHCCARARLLQFWELNKQRQRSRKFIEQRRKEGYND